LGLENAATTARAISEAFDAFIDEMGFLRQPAYWAEPKKYDDLIKEPNVANLIRGLSGEELEPAYVSEFLGVHYDAATNSVSRDKGIAEFYARSLSQAEPGTGIRVEPRVIEK